jgi:hypothetical protein
MHADWYNNVLKTPTIRLAAGGSTSRSSGGRSVGG